MYANNTALPLSVAVWLASDDYKYASHPKELSATSLLKSPRYILANLRAMYPEYFPEHLRPINTTGLIEPDIVDRTAVRIGTAIHSGIEESWKNYPLGMKALGIPEETINRIVLNPEQGKEYPEDSIYVYQENRLYKTMNIGEHEFTISGQYDMVIDGQLHDFKSTKTFTYTSGSNDDKYTLQGSIYRWLNPELITKDTININFIFLDWFKFNKTENYPPTRVFSKHYPLHSIIDTEAFIRKKLSDVVTYWNEPLENIPCCTADMLFVGKPKYKYYAKGYKEGARSTKNFDTLQEAVNYKIKHGSLLSEIIEHKGTPYPCPYCTEEEINQLSTVTHFHKMDIG